MSVVLIGNGLAGLACAIQIKLHNPCEEVLVVSKKRSESNTLISGHRYRARITNQGVKPEDEICSLFEKRNEGHSTFQMREFANLCVSEVNFWQHLMMESYDTILSLHVEDKREWFGPQFGSGKGKITLDWFNKIAEKLQVKFQTAEVTDVIIENGRVKKLIAEDQSKDVTPEEKRHLSIEGSSYILANGNIAGKLYERTTNIKINNSAQELAFKAGLQLVGGTETMFHPFGRCKPDGTPIPGCYETDTLENVLIYFEDGEQDSETMVMLKNHTAHEHFPEITKRFMLHGGKATLVFRDHIEQSRVAIHNNQLSVKTNDGVRVEGTTNLFAIGDASGMGYWTNYKERLPGTGLANCLVGAKLVAENVTHRISEEENRKDIIIDAVAANEPLDESRRLFIQDELRKINSEHLIGITFQEDKEKAKKTARDWLYCLREMPLNRLSQISMCVAFTHIQRLEKDLPEPLPLSKETLNEIRRETHPELKTETKVSYSRQKESCII